MFFVGSTSVGIDPATAPANHSPKFLLDEKALDVGLRALLQVSLDYLRCRHPGGVRVSGRAALWVRDIACALSSHGSLREPWPPQLPDPCRLAAAPDSGAFLQPDPVACR